MKFRMLMSLFVSFGLSGAFGLQELDAQRADRIEPAVPQEAEVRKERPDRSRIGDESVLPLFRERRQFNTEGTEEFRTFNGLFNNLERPREGAIFTVLTRFSPAAYGPNNSLSGQDRPNPRVISNAVVTQNISMPNDRGLSDYIWQWGQFVDHDIDLTEFQKPAEHADIPIPIGDPVFDANSMGDRFMAFERSVHRVRPFQINTVRQQFNEITAFVDGSNVYGSDLETSQRLRGDNTNGRMATLSDQGFFLPLKEDTDGMEFDAGDIRSSEQTGLSCMHTLFVREHNRIATEIEANNPGMDGELIFQLARKEVYSILQSITYNEWLPALLGPDNLLAPYEGYDSSVSPNIANEFSTAAFRFGHSMLNNQLLLRSDKGAPIAGGALLLKDAFFDANILLNFDLEPFLKGLATQQAQELDQHAISSIRNFLFGGNGNGFDLASLNIQRGRDHGLPDFNTIRIAYGLPALNSFAELNPDVLLQAQLSSVYDSIDQLDPWVGFLAEEHASNSSLGPTAIAVIKDQFERIRDGDRFWYEVVNTGDDLERIRNTKLSDVILRNTTLTKLQDNVFLTR